MRRREFITLLGGAATAWPLAARAQQPERVRRIGVLLATAADDAEHQAWVAAFHQGLALSGWIIGRNVRIDTRWATVNAAELRRHAAGVGCARARRHSGLWRLGRGAVLQATRTVPVVFPVLGDPVAAGFVDSLARPGGNATGFMIFEYSLAGKWLELLKQIAPDVTRVRCFGIPARPEPASLPPSRPWRRRSGWKSTRSMCATPARSSAPSRPSRAPRMAV